MVGVDAAFVWRGVPEMKPLFLWEGANGGQVPTINLFGGYRNLYGITKTPEIAVHRLTAEANKLAPYYKGVPIPLFDGYDLDTEPEDPVRYYETTAGVPPEIALHESSPRAYVDAVTGEDHPVIAGELISGRYGSTFPGTLSARTHLKVLHHDAEYALQSLAEPLGVLAAARGRRYEAAVFESMSRQLLQNGVHDCICGVSVDQVHERMDRSYRSLIELAVEESQASIDTIFAGFATGQYALSTTAMATTTVQRVKRHAIVAETTGIGITPTVSRHRITTVESPADGFTWENAHYLAAVDAHGISVDGRRVGQVIVRADDGDTYSSEPGDVLGVCEFTAAPIVESTSDVDALIRYDVALNVDDISVRARVRARFDDSPIVHFTVDLDSDGTGFRADMHFETGIETETALAGMPFDIVERPHVDLNLLPQEVEPELSAVLMGQREVRQVDEFPFQGFVALRDGSRASAVLTRGIRSYGSTADGDISVALRRSVEWLAKSGLDHRQGDAGPAMYVPGARSERMIRHELGYATVADGPGPDRGLEQLWRLNEGFQNPPLLINVEGSGPSTDWHVFAEDLPTTGMELIGDQAVVRVFNPADAAATLTTDRQKVSVRGKDLGSTDTIGAKEILSLAVPVDGPAFQRTPTGLTTITVHNLPSVRVGLSRSKPDPSVLAELETHRAALQREMAQVADQLTTADGADRYRLTHREVVLAREEAEVALSLELNRRLAVSDDIVSIPDDIDPEIAALGAHLNDLRVKRRIYDYVVQAL